MRSSRTVWEVASDDAERRGRIEECRTACCGGRGFGTAPEAGEGGVPRAFPAGHPREPLELRVPGGRHPRIGLPDLLDVRDLVRYRPDPGARPAGCDPEELREHQEQRP